MNGFLYGAELILELNDYLGKKITVKFNFGLENHMSFFDTTDLNLVDVDTLTINPDPKFELDLDDLALVGEHLGKLQRHPVFQSGRSFFQEGTNMYLCGPELLMVVFRWGS